MRCKTRAVDVGFANDNREETQDIEIDVRPKVRYGVE